jgi:cation diffusion facilitator CzcD-associated flavoprotein CzcO
VGGIWNYVPLPLPCSSGPPKDLPLAIPPTRPHIPRQEPAWKSSGAGQGLKEDDKGEAEFLTPLYDRLETNIPRDLMGFSDLDWPEDCQLFPQHWRVLEYLENYAEDVRHLVRFRTQVLDVRLREDEKWAVKVQKVAHGSEAEEEHTFDAVVVANGHFNVPYIPRVKGISDWTRAFPGSITHSKFYRLPSEYANKKVIVVGNSASGVDISAQIRQVCQRPLIVSQKSESFLSPDPTPTQIEKPPIAEYFPTSRSVKFEDGSLEENVDAVLYCTGYLYSFPFLSSLNPALITTGERVENLYQHIFYRPQPTLVFLVLNQKVIPFPVAEAQAAVIARVFSGRLALPSETEMEEWEREAVGEKGPGRGFHVLGFPEDGKFINGLYEWAMQADGEAVPKLGEAVERRRGGGGGGGGGEGRKVGKVPPRWGEKEFWVRERFSEIKKAFQALGEARHEMRTLESVGFDFERWKLEKEMERGEGKVVGENHC